MFNKELFLTHIKNTPVPQELGEPLVEMKQKSDIDTIADIIGTSNEPRPLQEQFMASAPLRNVLRNLGAGDVMDAKRKLYDTPKSGREEVLGSGFYEPFQIQQMQDRAEAPRTDMADNNVVRDLISSKRIFANRKTAAAFDAKQKEKQEKRDKFMSRQQSDDVSPFDQAKERLAFVNRDTPLDPASEERRRKLRTSTGREVDRRDTLARADMDPNREDYDDPIVQLGAHARLARKERREEKKSYGVRPKTGDYRLPGGGYDYDAMRDDMRERGEIA